MTRWEYLRESTVKLDANFGEGWQTSGRYGWELVSIYTTADGGSVAVFKRDRSYFEMNGESDEQKTK